MAEINLIDKPVFTHRQMAEMMFVTRSWTLNNPSGHEAIKHEKQSSTKST